MADQLPFLSQGAQLSPAMVMPQAQALPQLSNRQMAGQAIMAGANAYGQAHGVQGGGGMTPQQQQQLVMMLRQRMAAQQGVPGQPMPPTQGQGQGQGQGMPPAPGMP